MTGFVPYCGSAPVPGALHWNLDPVLIGALLVLAGANLMFARRRGVVNRDLGASILWLAAPLARIHLPAMQFERRAVFGSRHSTYGDHAALRRR